MEDEWRGGGRELVEGLPQQEERVSGLPGPPSFRLEENERARDRYYDDGGSLSPRNNSWNQSWGGMGAISREREARPWTGTSDQYIHQPGSAFGSASAPTYAQHQPGRWGADPESDARSGMRLPPIFLQSRQASPGQPILPHYSATGGHYESWAPRRFPSPPTSMGSGPGMRDEGLASGREDGTTMDLVGREAGLAMPYEQSLKRKPSPRSPSRSSSPPKNTRRKRSRSHTRSPTPGSPLFEGGGWTYRLELAQQPTRGRSCGQGDADRRALSAPLIARLRVYVAQTGVEEDLDRIDTTFLICAADLWSADGTEEKNLVQHPSYGQSSSKTARALSGFAGPASPSSVSPGPTAQALPSVQPNKRPVTASTVLAPASQRKRVEGARQSLPGPTSRQLAAPPTTLSASEAYSLAQYSLSGSITNNSVLHRSPPHSSPKHSDQTSMVDPHTYAYAYPRRLEPRESIDDSSSPPMHRDAAPTSPTDGSPQPPWRKASISGTDTSPPVSTFAFQAPQAHNQQVPLDPSQPPMLAFGGPEHLEPPHWPPPEAGPSNPWRKTSTSSSVSTSMSARPFTAMTNRPSTSATSASMLAGGSNGPRPSTATSTGGGMRKTFAPPFAAGPALSPLPASPSPPLDSDGSAPLPPLQQPPPSSRPSTRSTDSEYACVKNLVGALTTNAHKLKPPDGSGMGIFFVFHDLSVRTEGTFRLRLRLVSIGSAETGLHTGRKPVLCEAMTQPFEVMPAKKFPGMLDPTPLSQAFAKQGLRIPTRKGANRKRRKTDEDTVGARLQGGAEAGSLPVPTGALGQRGNGTDGETTPMPEENFDPEDQEDSPPPP